MKKLSHFTRWLLITVLILLLVGGAVLAYVALTSTGEVVVEECLSFVGDNTFSVSLYPQESTVAQLTVANASSLSIDVALTSTIIPNPKGMTVDIPKTLTVPATGQATIDITITAGKNAEPGIYAILIEFDR